MNENIDYLKQKLETIKTLLQLVWVALLSDIAGTISIFLKTDTYIDYKDISSGYNASLREDSSVIATIGALTGIFLCTCVVILVFRYVQTLKKLKP